MPTHLAILAVNVVQVYLAMGVVFAIAFFWRGIAALDSSAAEGTRPFRMVLVPGVVGLWPLLLVRWWTAGGGQPRAESNAHRSAAEGRS